MDAADMTLPAALFGFGVDATSVLAIIRAAAPRQGATPGHTRGIGHDIATAPASASAWVVITSTAPAFVRGRTDEKHAIMVVADPLTNVVVGDNQLAAQFPWDCRLVSIHAAVDVPSIGGPVVISLRDGLGRDLLTQPIQVDEGDLGSDTSVAPASIKAEWADLSAWEDVRVDVDAANGAKGLKVVIGVML